MSQLSVPMNQAAAPAREVHGWLVLSVDNLRFAVPQKDVKTIELFSALNVAVEGEPEAGWMELEGDTWPAYGFDTTMALQADTPSSRRFCVVFYAGEKLIGLVCDQVRLLPSDSDLSLQSVPQCLAKPDSPLKWISLLDGHVVTAAESGGLARYLNELEVRYGTD